MMMWKAFWRLTKSENEEIRERKKEKKKNVYKNEHETIQFY